MGNRRTACHRAQIDGCKPDYRCTATVVDLQDDLQNSRSAPLVAHRSLQVDRRIGRVREPVGGDIDGRDQRITQRRTK